MEKDLLIHKMQNTIEEQKKYVEMFEQEDDTFLYEGTDDRKIETMLKNIYMKKFKIYVKATPKKKSLWESDSEDEYICGAAIDENSFHNFAISASKIKNPKYTFVENIFLPNSSELKNFKNKLETWEKGKNNFYTSLYIIKDLSNQFNLQYYRNKFITS